ITLTNILHVPIFSLTLILVHRLAKANYTSIFSKQTYRVIEPLSRKIRMLGSHKNRLYHLDLKAIPHVDRWNVTVNINILH
ncbi:hypothetical protein K439DRAFT_1283756, partial [Ramaria rubella]